MFTKLIKFSKHKLKLASFVFANARRTATIPTAFPVGQYVVIGDIFGKCFFPKKLDYSPYCH